MRLNILERFRTHEGARATPNLSPEAQLRRSVLACLLWEDEFYEDGVTIAERIRTEAAKVPPEVLAALAREARDRFNLRHAPLWLLTVLVKTGAGKPIVAETVEAVIQRADEMGEFLAMYWKDGRKPVPAQAKKGLARAFAKFDAYELAKYDRDGAVKLRDVLRLVHPKPESPDQAALWRKVLDRTLEAPDTWEVALSGGADKKETFERLIRDGKLGYLALLRNLRSMMEAGVDRDLVAAAIVARKGARRVLPFRYVAAARAAPQLEPWIDQALCEAILEMPILEGRTVILVDVSGSMEARLSAKSDMRRIDAAAALGAIVHGNLRVFSFSNEVVEVPPRRGMAGVDAIVRSQPHGGTELGKAVAKLNAEVPHDRLIVISDEQTADPVPDPACAKAYMVNVASNRNGIGYGRWTHIDGFSEGVLRYIHEVENDG